MKMKAHITRSLTLICAVLLIACQAPTAVDEAAVKVKLADGKFRTIEATVPTFTATVMKVNVHIIKKPSLSTQHWLRSHHKAWSRVVRLPRQHLKEHIGSS